MAQMSAAFVDVPRVKLNNGEMIPAIALGTYLGFSPTKDGLVGAVRLDSGTFIIEEIRDHKNGIMKPQNKELRDVVRRAIDLGYRHIDSASVYLTEEEVGEAIRDKIAEGVVKRSDMFVTTKLWNTDHGHVEKALNESLKKLGLDYVDLYLMHWPMALNENFSHADIDYLTTWRDMERLQQAGLARAVGLSNFNQQQLARVLKDATVRPAVLQIEVHPQIAQRNLVSYAQSEGLVVMGYSPLGSLVYRYGQEVGGPRTDSPPLMAIADRVKKTTPQVVLRWLVERKVIPIPKTVNLKRLEENCNIFDFELTPDDMATIDAYDGNKRFTLPSFWQTHPNYPFDKVDNPIDNPFVINK